MSKFDELLKRPLPSQINGSLTTEDIDIDINDDRDDDDEDDEDDDSGDDNDTTVNMDDIDDAKNADDDFDPDDMSDEELEAMDKELGGEVMDEIIGGDDSEETLTPDEEIQADDLMQTAATSLLVNDELSTEEKAELLSNTDEVNTIINEGFMRESDIKELAANTGLVKEGHNYNKPMLIRLDAASKKKQLYALAVNVSAAAHNDPDYRKYKKVLRLRKIIKTKLERKYRTEANKRMRVYYKRLIKSSSPTLNKIGNKG